MKIGELVKLSRPVYGLFVVPYSAVGVIVNSRREPQEWLYSVQWSDGTRHRHWCKELELISGTG